MANLNNDTNCNKCKALEQQLSTKIAENQKLRELVLIQQKRHAETEKTLKWDLDSKTQEAKFYSDLYDLSQVEIDEYKILAKHQQERLDIQDELMDVLAKRIPVIAYVNILKSNGQDHYLNRLADKSYLSQRAFNTMSADDIKKNCQTVREMTEKLGFKTGNTTIKEDEQIAISDLGRTVKTRFQLLTNISPIRFNSAYRYYGKMEITIAKMIIELIYKEAFNK